MQNITAGYIGQVILNLFVFLLLIAIYTYIDKLEQTGCACAVHPNREFIKSFSLFAIIFLMIITFIPMSSILQNFGTLIAGLFAFVKFVFYIVCIVFFFMTVDYVRYLINEKCKCSDDYRRELILAGSIMEITLIMLVFVVIIMLPIVFNSVTIIVENMDTLEKEVSSSMRNPYQSIKTIPSKMKQMSKMVSKIGSKSKQGIKKLTKPNSY